MKTYTSFGKYSTEFDPKTHCVRIEFSGYKGWFSFKLDRAEYHGEKCFDLSDYDKVEAYVVSGFDNQTLCIDYLNGPQTQETLSIRLILSTWDVYCYMNVMGHYNVYITGEFSFGSDGGRPVSIDRRGLTLRAGYGPAVGCCDNALFDVAHDAAVQVTGTEFKMHYDWSEHLFHCSIRTAGDDVQRDFKVALWENLFAKRFGTLYSPMNHNTCFPVPPVGWMTWYAVQFDASEQTVLENARFQMKHLKAYGANAIWVDWEWYHQDFSGTGKAGTDVFHPDPDRYPHGLKYLADEIRKMGFIPAIWIGATNDPNENEFFVEHPEAVLVQQRSWCGQYFIDPTNPNVQHDYIPRVFKNIVDYGYEALKWDCLPITFERLDSHHEKMYDPTLSTDEAMHRIVEIARNIVGRNFYMLSCSGRTRRDILFASDIFDAARIGGDIFRWSEFITSGVERILKLYHYHNTVLYNDPDNVVIRKKYNTFDQAVSRVSIVSMLGLPFTIGDRLIDLEKERLYLIQHAIPILDIHPMDVRNNVGDGRQLVINLSIATPYENWNVVDILNLLEEKNCARISFRDDLDIDVQAGDRFLLFDFWKRQYLGEMENSFDVELDACASRIIGVRRKTGFPQIIATTRHISMGALELTDVCYDSEKRMLSGISDVVEGDDYALYIYLPENMRIFYESNANSVFNAERIDSQGIANFDEQYPDGSVWKIALPTEIGGKIHWNLAFTSCHGA